MQMDYTDIFVNCSIENAQQMVQTVFQQNTFEINWMSQFNGKAQRGSKGMNVAFGALAQYYEIDFQIMTLPDGTVAVRLIKATSGWMGGVIGAHKVKKQYEGVVNMLSGYFQSQGVYRGRNPP